MVISLLLASSSSPSTKDIPEMSLTSQPPRPRAPHRPPRPNKSNTTLHRTASHHGILHTTSALALTTSRGEMERQDSRGSDEVSVTSAPSGRVKGKGHHVSRLGVGGRRKSQVHLAGDHARRGSRNSRSDTNLSRLGLTALARPSSKTRLARGEEEEEEWEEAPGGGRVEGSSDGDDDDDDDDEEGDELVIRTKKKTVKKEPPARGFAVVASPAEQEAPVPTTPAPRTTSLAAPLERPRNPSPVPSEAGTLIATPTKPHPAPTTPGIPSRHLRTRNSHTSLQSLTAGSLRSIFAGPHHPLSSSPSGKPARRREGTAPPVVSGETARGAWAGPGAAVEGLPASPTRGEERPNAASASLRKASFTGSINLDVSGLPRVNPATGRLSAHSVAQKAALLPTMSSRPSSAGSTDAANRHQQERESVNLVSRFVTLPPQPTSGPANSVFPDSPFAGAHASLVRTLMEEGARLLPIDPSNPSATLRRTETTRATTTGKQRAAIPSPITIPYGAGPAPGGQEWVLGLTPFEMSVQRCLAQRKGAVRLATGRSLGPLGA